MKYIYILISTFFLLFSFSSIAQVEPSATEQNNSTTVVEYNANRKNLKIIPSVTIELDKEADKPNLWKFILRHGSDSYDFVIHRMEYSTFKSLFKTTLKELIDAKSSDELVNKYAALDPTVNSISEISNQANQKIEEAFTNEAFSLFIDFNIQQNVVADLENEPVAGDMHLKKTSTAIFVGSGRKMARLGTSSFEIDSVSLEITDGYIENIKVEGEFECEKLTFSNIYPIGFSRKIDFDKNLQKHHLFCIMNDHHGDMVDTIHLNKELEALKEIGNDYTRSIDSIQKIITTERMLREKEDMIRSQWEQTKEIEDSTNKLNLKQFDDQIKNEKNIANKALIQKQKNEYEKIILEQNIRRGKEEILIKNENKRRAAFDNLISEMEEKIKELKDKKIENQQEIDIRNQKITFRKLTQDQKTLKICLGDFLKYEYLLVNFRRDYSPKNDTFKLKESVRKLKVKKTKTFKILKAKVYTDFIGLANNSPNGIFQTEVAKKIPLITKRLVTKKRILKKIRSKNSHFMNFGFLSFINPNISITKFESKDKLMPINYLDRLVNEKYKPIKYQSTVSILRHEVFNVGVDLNLLLLDIPRWKVTFSINSGYKHGITAAKDSIRHFNASERVYEYTSQMNRRNLYTNRVYGEAKAEFFSDERFGFDLFWRSNWLFLADNEILQVQNNQAFLILKTPFEERDNNIHQTGMEIFFRPFEGRSGYAYFRSAYNVHRNYWRTNFLEVQLGYSFYVLGRYRDKIVKKVK